jgi:two-component system sensor histidine kinase TctE
VNQLLSLARAEPPVARGLRTVQRLDLTQLARDATTDWVPHALERGIDLGFDDASTAVAIEGDPFLLREMLNNVLDNAIRYTQSGGQVTVRVKCTGENTALTVEDNGPGIPDAERAQVFQRFYRVLGTGGEGCGLGLAIVREIAQGHAAEVTLESGANGVGTTVAVTFRRLAREQSVSAPGLVT